MKAICPLCDNEFETDKDADSASFVDSLCPSCLADVFLESSLFDEDKQLSVHDPADQSESVIDERPFIHNIELPDFELAAAFLAEKTGESPDTVRKIAEAYDKIGVQSSEPVFYLDEVSKEISESTGIDAETVFRVLREEEEILLDMC